MNIKSWSNHSKYVVLTDNSSGQLAGNYSTFVNFLKVKEVINNIAFSDKSTYSDNGNIYNRKITSGDAQIILDNIEECKWNSKTALMLLVANQLKLRI
tara:strand:+ start:285 stop:578 length:294 start_codon:yes stop_codon:yes gene_type:complete